MASSVLNSQGLHGSSVRKYIYIGEKTIHFEGDSEMGRSPCCAKEGLNRGAWTATEDRILTEYIKNHGEGKWRNLPKKAGLKRCGKSCRLRWLNYLRPDIKRGNITHDEEELIIRLHKLLGNRWSLIAGRLPGRTDNEIKNYWNTNIGKKIIQGLHGSTPNLKTRIQSDEKLNSMTDPSPIRPRTSPETLPPVHLAKPSRCTKVFFPTEPLGNDQIFETTTRPVLLGPSSMVGELPKGPDSLPLILSGTDGDPADFVPDFEMDAHFISEFLNSDFLQLCEFNTGVEGDSNTTSNTSQYSSSMEAPPMLINEETLQKPNIFSIDSFLDSEMDWFC